MESKTEVYNIYFDEALDAVVMEWDGYATSEQFREGTELMLNTLIKHKASKVLADIKDMVLIGLEDQKWMDRYFLPRAIKFGFKVVAILRPQSYFNKIAIESISFKVDQEQLKLSLFDNLEEAKDWLSKF